MTTNGRSAPQTRKRSKTFSKTGTLASIALTCTISVSHASQCGMGSTGDTNRASIFHDAATGHLNLAISQTSRHPYLRGMAELIAREPRLAIESFADAARSIETENKNQKRQTIAKIAYWSSIALKDLGKTRQSLDASKLAHNQINTFYGSIPGTGRISTEGYPHPNYSYINKNTSNALVSAIIWNESRFNTGAVSYADALGLMQIIPQTASEITRRYGYRINLGELTRNPDYNIAIGSTYLGQLLKRYRGYLPLAISAYNAGPYCTNIWIKRFGDPRTNVNPLLWIEAIPITQTRDYVKSVLSTYIVYQQIYKKDSNHD